MSNISATSVVRSHFRPFDQEVHWIIKYKSNDEGVLSLALITAYDVCEALDKAREVIPPGAQIFGIRNSLLSP